MASLEPVDAPDGTAARPETPDSSTTSASIVGLPRESRISRATTSTIALILIAPRRSYHLSGNAIGPFIVADHPIADFAQFLDGVLMRRMGAVRIEIGASGERHVDAIVVGDRPVGRVPAVLEPRDAFALALEAREHRVPHAHARIDAGDAGLQLDQYEMDEHGSPPCSSSRSGNPPRFT